MALLQIASASELVAFSDEFPGLSLKDMSPSVDTSYPPAAAAGLQRLSSKSRRATVPGGASMGLVSKSPMTGRRDVQSMSVVAALESACESSQQLQSRLITAFEAVASARAL